MKRKPGGEGRRRKHDAAARKMKSKKSKRGKASPERREVAAGSRSRSSSGRLCTNGCPVADLWMNCAELHEQLKGWLCKEGSEVTQEGSGGGGRVSAIGDMGTDRVGEYLRYSI